MWDQVFPKYGNSEQKRFVQLRYLPGYNCLLQVSGVVKNWLRNLSMTTRTFVFPRMLKVSTSNLVQLTFSSRRHRLFFSSNKYRSGQRYSCSGSDRQVSPSSNIYSGNTSKNDPKRFSLFFENSHFAPHTFKYLTSNRMVHIKRNLFSKSVGYASWPFIW